MSLRSRTGGREHDGNHHGQDMPHAVTINGDRSITYLLSAHIPSSADSRQSPAPLSLRCVDPYPSLADRLPGHTVGGPAQNPPYLSDDSSSASHNSSRRWRGR